eukprot:scaffold15685_cov255-Alexandrium_tamarense.AAC.5
MVCDEVVLVLFRSGMRSWYCDGSPSIVALRPNVNFSVCNLTFLFVSTSTAIKTKMSSSDLLSGEDNRCLSMTFRQSTVSFASKASDPFQLMLRLLSKWLAQTNTLQPGQSNFFYRSTAKDSREQTPLHHIRFNNGIDEQESLEIVNIIIVAHPDSVKLVKGVDGELPIHFSARYTSLEVGERLVDEYHESTTVDSRESTTFLFAYLSGKVDTSNESPARIAAKTTSLGVIKFLEDKYPKSLCEHIPFY